MTLKEYCDREFNSEIDRRERRGRTLAARFPELARATDYTDFLLRAAAAGLELDFITSCAMWKALQ
jgi:hypothetical protein